MSLSESLSKLDATLIERVMVPHQILMEDYAAVAGADGTAAQELNCDVQYRLMATAWIGSWGSVSPWLLSPSSRSSSTAGGELNKTTVILRLPQSQIRHFLLDASLFIKTRVSQEIKPRISRAVLRLGPDQILQSLDSEFACNISSIYKHGREFDELSIGDKSDGSYSLVSPLFFDAPLSVLPLCMPNTPLTEIEYDVILPQGEESSGNLKFITEVISSPGEAGLHPGREGKPEVIVQHLPTIITFKSGPITTTSPEVSIGISTPNLKLARSIYIRVFDSTNEDIPNAINTIDIVGPNSKSLLGEAYTGSICRNHFKRRFSRKPVSSLPYYVFTFTTSPNCHIADFGRILPEGSRIQINLRPELVVATSQDLGIEVCVETFERMTWRR